MIRPPKFLKRIFANSFYTDSKKKKPPVNYELAVISVAEYGIVMYDPNGIIISWNKGAELMSGFKAKDIIGKSFEIFYTKEDIQKGEPRYNLQKAKEDGHYEKNAWRIRRDGTGGWANIVLTALKDNDGVVQGYVVILRDITEAKNIKEQLELFARQINYCNEPIYTIDEHYRVTSWNRGSEKLYGYNSEEVLGKNHDNLLKTTITDQGHSSVVDTIDKDGYWAGELKQKTKTGKEIFVRSSTSVIRDTSGKHSGFIVASFDITVRKKLQAEVNHLANMVEQSTDAINSTDLNGRLISWNTGAEKLYGYTREEALGETASSLGLAKIAPQEAAAIFKEIIEKGSRKTEMGLYRKDGSSFYGLVTASAVKDENAEVTSIAFTIKDISVHKQLQDHLRQTNEMLEEKVKERTEAIYRNEKRFRAMVENNQGIIYIMNRNFGPVYVSPASERITGYTREEREKMDPLETTHPDERDEHLKMAEKIFANPGKPFNIRLRTKHKKGHYLWMEGVVTNLLHDASIGGIIINLIDITERKNIEVEKRKTEVLYSKLFQNMLQGFAYCKAFFENGKLTDCIYLAVNNEYERQKNLKNITGKRMSEVAPYLLSPNEIYYNLITEVALSGISVKHETYIKRLGKWFSLSLYCPEDEHFVCLIDDITERKHAEETIRKSELLYRSLFENMLHGFAYCKGIFEDEKLVDFIYLAVNNEFEIQSGLKDITGKKVSEVVPDLFESDSSYAGLIANVALAGAAVKFETYAKPLKKWYASSLYSPEKGYFVSLIDNITERKQAEEKIKKLNEELEERVKSRTEQLKKTNEDLEAFSYSVSHDLRAPLRVIMGFTSILEEDYSSKLDDEAKRIIGVIANNTVRMGNLIDDLLSFSKTSRHDIIKTTFDSETMVMEIIRETTASIKNEKKVVWDISSLPPVFADITTIRQVWINLISNAIKYSSKTEQPKIQIGSFIQDEFIVFFVKDNGIGFDEKYRNKLFKVFQRLQDGDEFEGTGIGLAIVKKIISKHGGKVWAQGILNKGSCFYFSLPTHK